VLPPLKNGSAQGKEVKPFWFNLYPKNTLGNRQILSKFLKNQKYWKYPKGS